MGRKEKEHLFLSKCSSVFTSHYANGAILWVKFVCIQNDSYEKSETITEQCRAKWVGAISL